VFHHQGLPADHEKNSYQNRWREYHVSMARFTQRDPAGAVAGLDAYLAYGASPVADRDPTGLFPVSPGFGALCWCARQPWQTKCDPTGCGSFFAPPQPPPPQSPPNPAEPCDYPNRKVCVGLLCWESQCVCQCAGDSPGLNCIRGCIRCAHSNGAPVNVDAERLCQQKCGLTPNELARLDCCLTQTWNQGGCAASFPVEWPPRMNPNPNNNACTRLPIP
jgi:RHS repeat-associated protein